MRLRIILPHSLREERRILANVARLLSGCTCN